MIRAFAAATCLGTLAACGTPSRPAPAPAYHALGGEVARVGDVPIAAALVESTARARGTSTREALDSLVDDALAARGAEAAGLDRSAQVQWEIAAARARSVPVRFGEQARAAGPPTDDELATITVVHAVVLRGRGLDPDSAPAAARAIAEAAATCRSDDEFLQRAPQAAGSRVVVSPEALEPFDVSGKTADGKSFDPDFVAAAFALHRPGEISPVVETPFGWHVIRLVARALPQGANLELRRRDLADAVVDLRARTLLAGALRAGRARAPIQISPAADALTASVIARP